MHLLRTETRSLDEAEAAVDLGQTPADILFLSFADSDLALVAAAAAQRPGGAMSLRLANLAMLKHPYSVDLYIEKVARKARFILVRLLGGLDYWRYGVEELSRASQRYNFALAAVPGDAMQDPRLDASSTVRVADLRHIQAVFQHGDVEHIAALLDFIEVLAGTQLKSRKPPEPKPAPAAGLFDVGCRALERPKGHALIVFYRSFLLAKDTAAIEALADALAARELCVTSIFVPSLKDSEATAFIRDAFGRNRPDVIINTTGFSARLDGQAGTLDTAGVPVLQAILAGAIEEQWRENQRGLAAADLAMNVVLPELDGRLISRAIAFKQEGQHRADLEFTPRVHAPSPSRIAFVADLAAAWVTLRKTPPLSRKIACILPDYPGRQGRGGYAVGLDVARSIISIAAMLRDAGYDIGALPPADELMRCLEDRAFTVRVELADYALALEAMPAAFKDSIQTAWGSPEQEAQKGAFVFSILRAGNLIIALQPDRSLSSNRKADYHNAALPPCHSFTAFYAWHG